MIVLVRVIVKVRVFRPVPMAVVVFVRMAVCVGLAVDMWMLDAEKHAPCGVP